MIAVKSTLACIIVLCGVVIVPQMNELSAEDYEKVSTHKDFKQLVRDGNIVVISDVKETSNIEDGEDPFSGDVDINKMKLTELRDYATHLEISVPEGATKAEIISLIKLIDEE